MCSCNWFDIFVKKHRNRMIDHWLLMLEKEFPGKYNAADLRINGSIYLQLLVDIDIPILDHSLFEIIPRMCEYHASNGTPATDLLHSSHIWRKSIMEHLHDFIANDPHIPQTEVMRVFSLLHDRIDTIQRIIVDIFATYTRALVDQKQETIGKLHNDRLNLLGKVSASMAHELRNPLFAMEGFVKLIRNEITRGTPDLDKLISYLNVIQQEFDGLYGQITRFLSFSKNSGVEEQYGIYAAEDLVASVIGLIKPRLNDEGVEVKINLSLNNPLYCQKVAIQQVLSNLISNSVEALSATPRKKEIRIYDGEDETGYFIHVVDNGPGIPKEYHDTLFTPFVSYKSNGTGLGLAICKQIMEKNNGEIKFQSQPGETKFSLRFANKNKAPH